MKNWRPLLLAAAAALSLQACDVQVHSGDTKVQPPQATLPEDTKLNDQSAATPAPAPVGTSVAQAPAAPAAPAAAPLPETTAQAPAAATDASAALPAPAADVTAQAPSSPDTGTLGASAAPAATTTAAPTELQKFFENNAPAAKADKASAKK